MLQSFKLAIKAILANKIRSLLTMLGIIIGVAAVIILVSVVSGYMGQMVEQFEEMGVNNISIFCRNMNTRHFDDTDIYEFWDENPTWLSGVSPYVTLSNAKVKSGNDNLESTSITGVSEDYIGKEFMLESTYLKIFLNSEASLSLSKDELEEIGLLISPINLKKSVKKV